ncbi:MAG: hypothetical protein AMS22_00615, partial [Thiotrichales bacterium SG8_50]
PPGSSLLSMLDRFEQVLVEPFVSHCLIEAVVQTNSSRMTALGQKADIQPGRMSALTDTGRPDSHEPASLNGS